MRHTRIAKLTDAKQIASLHLASWLASYGHILPQNTLDALTLEEKISDWKGWLGTPISDSTTLVLEEDEQIIAYISFGPSRHDEATHVDGEIYAIYIAADHKRKKLGTLLMDEALTRLTKRGFKQITVWVLKDNIAAQDFYQALGFIRTHMTKAEKFKDILLEEVQYKK
ncbi:GNAT family N-acetyltransferase [soil metagenome]